MPRAKRRYGLRMTRSTLTRSPRHPQDGRPKGTFKRFAFHETKLGFMLRYEAPLVYHLLRIVAPRHIRFEPEWEVVKAVCDASDDPSLRKPKFHRYLEEYRQHGVFCRRAKRLTPSRLAYYESVRRRKIAQFVARYREELTALSREARVSGEKPRPMMDFVQEILKKKE